MKTAALILALLLVADLRGDHYYYPPIQRIIETRVTYHYAYPEVPMMEVPAYPLVQAGISPQITPVYANVAVPTASPVVAEVVRPAMAVAPITYVQPLTLYVPVVRVRVIKYHK